MFRFIHIGLLLALTAAFSALAPAAQANPSSLSALQAVATTSLDHDLGRTLQQRGSVDATVAFRNGAILSKARAAGGVRAAIGVLESEYRTVKQRVFARAGNDVRVLRGFEHLPSAVVRFRSLEALVAISTSPEVLSVTAPASFDPALDRSLDLINADDAAIAGNAGAGTYVAVLDSGADYRRSAFGSCAAPNSPSSCRIFFAKEYGPGQDGTPDDDGHGTNVSGIVAGVAPATKIFALDVFTPDGDGLGAREEDITAALNDVVAWKKQGYNIRAVNMSIGWHGTYHTTTCTTNPTGQTNPMAPLFSQLRLLNILPIVSAGNDASVWEEFVDGISYPACTAGAVSVGAVYDEWHGIQKFGAGSSECWDWATATDQVTCFSQSSPNLSLLAPGAFIDAAGLSQAGTSQAAPHVAGAVAVLAAARPSASADTIQTALTTTGPLVADARFGNRAKRRLDVTAALAALPAGDTTPPVVSSVSQVMPSIISTPGTTIDSYGRVPVKATWSASDAGSGVAAFDAQVSTNGAWTQLTTSGTQTSVTAVAPPGANAYQFRVRARDAAGNWSGWAYGTTFKLTAFQEDSPSIAFAGTWTRPAWAAAWGGYERTSGTAGSTATLRFTGRNIAWVAPVAASRGQAYVFVDGTHVRTIDLYSSATVAKTVAFSYYWTASGPHTITVKVAGTSGRPYVDVDAFVVMN